MSQMKPHWSNKLTQLGVCHGAVEWARGFPSLVAAWKACKRGDWMLWLAGRAAGPPESPSRRRLVLAACACARQALRYVKRGEARPRAAIETTERWAKRVPGVTLDDVRAAADATYAAYAAVHAAYALAAYAAVLAANVVHAEDAVHAAVDAADAAAEYAHARARAARLSSLAKSARIVRRFYPKPPRLGRGR